VYDQESPLMFNLRCAASSLARFHFGRAAGRCACCMPNNPEFFQSVTSLGMFTYIWACVMFMIVASNADLGSQKEEREETQIRLWFKEVLTLLDSIHGNRQSLGIVAVSHQGCCLMRAELQQCNAKWQQ